MNATPNPPRRGLAGRPVLTATIAVAVLVGAGLGGVALANRDDPDSPPLWQGGPSSAPVSAAPSEAAPADAGRTESTKLDAISLSATGDIVMGGVPRFTPPNEGRDLFKEVKPLLGADLVMGNLEHAITDDTGVRKCAANSTNCYAFRVPPTYAGNLKDAGFQLMNTANNHANDFGPAGYRNTQKALEQVGLAHTGAKDAITVADVKGVKVAVVGFAPYDTFNNVNDLAHATEVIKTAATRADIVVVQVHMGTEGRDKTHVKPGSEFLGSENRGDPMKFSRTVIDAGADLVVGHGPHVLRGMEFYQGRLIAYSLGNFVGGNGALGSDGVSGYTGVLKVSLKPDGEWAGGEFKSAIMGAGGVPRPDSQGRGRKQIADLSTADFGDAGARVADDGSIAPRR
jgi:poly-gamma-glutamate capsule biosynthesis protein CapA/YwtB (metallophosphatase superfamily)